MASRIYQNCLLVITALEIAFIQGTSLKLSLEFTSLSPPEVVVLKNYPLLLNCTGRSEAGPLQILWRHQGSPIEDDRKQVLANGSLVIEKVSSQKKHSNRDDGNYTCVLRNKVGVLLSRPIRVVIARMSRTFISEPESLTAFEGANARFTCQIHSLPPAHITWFHNEQLLPHNDSRYTLLPSGTLQIAGITANDAGYYQCQCSNIARHRLSEKALLTVMPKTEDIQPLTFLSTPESVYAVVNNSAVLECLLNGSPTAEVLWKTEDGEKIETDHITVLGQSNLLFLSVQPRDSDTYVCTASTLDPKTEEITSISQKVSLIVQEPPKFLSIPESHVNPPAQTSRLECAVDGNPTPSVEWLKNGEPLYINGRIKLKIGNVLVISQTVSNDSGIYQCVASNSVAVKTVAARLLVNPSVNQPKPPEGLRARTISSNAIHLSWNPAVSPTGLTIQAYTVHYLLTSGGLEQQTVAVNTSQIIDKLKSFTNYTFYVRAYNGKSASEPSDQIVQMTGEDVPLTAPVVMLMSRSPTALHLQWNDLPPEKARGIISGHRIHYRKHRQASYNVIDVPASVREYTITGLQQKKKYDVRVMSGTKAGFPVLLEVDWPWKVFEMPDAATAKIPLQPIMHLTVVNTTTLEVGWSMPSGNVYPVNSFHLSYRQQGHPFRGPIVISANSTKFLLSNLQPHKLYEVTLVAKNSEGESQEIVKNIITFSGDNPNVETVEVVEPPLHLEAEPISSTDIHLIWKSPDTSKNVSYYTVRYHLFVANDLVNKSLIHYIRSTNNEVTITGLAPYALYVLSVRSHDVHNQQGPFSQKVECRTKEDIPSPPRDVTWLRVDATSVRLNWLPPQHPNGIVTAYHILYNDHIGISDLGKWSKKVELGTELTSLLSDLLSNTAYYVCIKAENTAGMSSQTPYVSVKLAMGQNNVKPPMQEISEEHHDPMLGIIVGVSIGGSCIVASALILLYRSRFCSGRPAPPLPSTSNGRYSLCCNYGSSAQLNGHAGGIASKDKRPLRTDMQEMDCFTPIMGHIPNGRTDHHLDTKGGYPTPSCNGKGNGCPRQMLNDSHHSSSDSTQAESHQDAPIFKPRVRYRSGDSQDEGNEADSSTSLLHQGESGSQHSDMRTIDSFCTPQKDRSTINSLDESATNQESSCNTKSSDTCCPTVTQGAVPQMTSSLSLSSSSSSSSSITSPTSSNILAEGSSKQNSVPSNACLSSQENEPPQPRNNRAAGSKHHSSLPYSVNAFLSPLISPRFSQSASTHSSTEFT